MGLEFLHSIKKYVLRSLFFILTAILLVFVLLQIPFVQTQLVHFASSSLSKELNHTVEIGRLDLTLLGNVELEDVSIKDAADSSLLSVERLQLNFALSKLFSSDCVIIDEATLTKAQFYIRTKEDKSNLNVFAESISSLFPKDSTKVDSTSGRTVIRSIRLIDGSFGIFSDTLCDINSFEGSFFSLQNINTKLSDFYIHEDTIEASIAHLKTQDLYSPLDVKDLSVFFRMTDRSLEFHKLEASLNDSYVKEKDKLTLKYRSFDDFKDFVKRVKIKADLENSIIHTKDLAIFSPSFLKYDDLWKVSGYFSGSISRFKAKNLDVRFGENSRILGKISADGLPNITETFTELDFNNSYILLSDVKQYIPTSTYADAEKFKFIQLNSKFIGFPSDFVAYGDFSTGLGSLKSDVKFNPSSSGVTEYKGQLSAVDFDLGNFLDIENIGKATFEGDVKGYGFKVETAHIETNSYFEQIELNGYNYKNINANLQLEGGYGSGNVVIADENIDGSLQGAIDMRSEMNTISLTTDLTKANLKQLNFLKDSSTVNGKMTIDLKGPNLVKDQNIDRFTGSIKIDTGHFFYKTKHLDLTNTEITAQEEDESNRRITINSNYINSVIDGDFKLSKLPQDLMSLYQEYLLSIDNHKDDIQTYYEEKKISPDSYAHNIDYSVNFKNLNPIIKLFMPKVFISKNAFIKGKYYNTTQVKFTMEGDIDKMEYNEQYLLDNSINFSASKLANASQILSRFSFNSSSQYIDENLSTEKMNINGVWKNNEINFSAFTKQVESKNHLNLAGKITLLEDSIEFHVDTSELQVLDEFWRFEPKNSVLMTSEKIIFKNINIFNLDQKLLINGSISEDPTEKLFVRISGFKIHNLKRFIGNELDGEIYAKVFISDLYKHIKLNSRVITKNLTYNGTQIGSSAGDVSWSDQDERFNINLSHYLDESKILSITGDVKDVFEEKNKLNLSVNLNEFNALIAEPFVYENVNNIDGKIDGGIKITGSTDAPLLEGELTMKDLKCHIVYLNTDYSFHNSKIYFKENKAYFKKMVIKDHLEKIGVLDGSIAFGESVYTDLNFYFEKFNLMNKQVAPDQDAAFYGSFYGSGDLNIKGYADDLSIYSKELRTENRTKIYIPLEGYETAEDKTYIRFISRKDSISTDSSIKKLDLSGVKVDLNLSVTDQTYTEIIFDKNAGDIMKGYGSGDMKIQLDTRGDFNLYGNYVINRGSYNFTLGNVINKEFIVEPNSSITWTGDPYKGKMDINANYIQNTSLTPILDTALVDFTRSETRRKYPVSVKMNLTEELLSPELDFDITVFDYPSSLPGKNNTSVSTDEFINEFYSTINSNEQELNRQVFSLILLKRLASINSGNSNNSGGGASGSVSEFLGNYLSHILSQVDENLEIDLDLADLNSQTEDNTTVSLSYSFFEGRFKVSRSSTFSNNKNSSSTTTQNNNTNELVGDWTLEYAITSDGKLKIKAFNKSEPDLGTISQNNSVNMTYGASLLHSQNFNKIGDIFKRKKKKVKKKKR